MAGDNGVMFVDKDYRPKHVGTGKSKCELCDGYCPTLRIEQNFGLAIYQHCPLIEVRS
jgi:Pyruvate/2-oxoacid:ferredoxin oxidoreductase delta subunit